MTGVAISLLGPLATCIHLVVVCREIRAVLLNIAVTCVEKVGGWNTGCVKTPKIFLIVNTGTVILIYRSMEYEYHLNIEVGGDGDAPGLGHLRQRPYAVLDVDPLVDGEPGALRHAEGRPQELDEDRLTRLKSDLLIVVMEVPKYCAASIVSKFENRAD